MAHVVGYWHSYVCIGGAPNADAWASVRPHARTHTHTHARTVARWHDMRISLTHLAYVVYACLRASRSSSPPQPGRRCSHARHAERRQPIMTRQTPKRQQTQRMLRYMRNARTYLRFLKAARMKARLPRPALHPSLPRSEHTTQPQAAHSLKAGTFVNCGCLQRATRVRCGRGQRAVQPRALVPWGSANRKAGPCLRHSPSLNQTCISLSLSLSL